ncbi:MAG TPA: hypothetical protein VM533_10985 [Fimbriiglobus sp.]|jgi:hypothetical protein|nr:hypothetical protein [Fimbriiglobus sp.]
MMPFRLSTVGLALVGLFALPSPAQPPTERREPIPTLRAVGTEAFRGLLHYHKVEPVRPGEIAEPDYSDLIVVVFGNPRVSSRNRVDPNPYTQRALRNGGAVLIAVDSQLTLTDFFPDQPDARITGDAVTCPDGIGAYDGFADCPLAVPRRPGEIVAATSDSEWGLFLGITQLAMNKPSTLVMGSKSRFLRSELAGFPPKAHVRTALGQWSNPANRLFAAAGSGRRGESPFQCLVLSDPSVFSNQMMAPPEGKPPNHNVVFADRVVQWLRGPNGRSKCLFIENGILQSNFDVVRYESLQGMPPIPIPPLPDPLDPELQRKVTDTINRGIARWQDDDRPNEIVAGTDNRFGRVVRFLSAFAALMLLALLVRRVWKGRHEPDVPPIPADTGRVAGTAPPGSLARRREEILQTGDYGGVLREYLQQLFASRGLPEATVQPHKLPEVRVQGRGNTTLREDLRILWDVAFGPRPRPVSYTRWKELEPMIDAVRRAAAEGRWRFADTGDAA